MPPRRASKRQAAVADEADTTERPRKQVKVNGDSAKPNAEQISTTKPPADSPEDKYPIPVAPIQQTAPSDLYLDTVNRNRLDFDFEKLCSVSLSNINVYACLVCGKYFQGKGKSSHAYFHSLDQDHHVFINMYLGQVWVLPEGYEVKDASLNDIKYVVNPKYSRGEVIALDRSKSPSYDLQNKRYIPGYVGLNNIKDNDYLNVVIQALAHVPPLRNFMMLEDLSSKSELVQRFGTLVRKIWNPRAFKGHVSPHELLQEVSKVSEKKFQLTAQGDPVDFLGWFLNTLHRDLGGSKRPGSSIIHKIFQGAVHIETQEIIAQEIDDETIRDPMTKFNIGKDTSVVESPFLFLALDLPPAPVFLDDVEKGNIIPQVPITQILAKYNGHKAQEIGGQLRRYQITKLPPYIILHIRRFTNNNFMAEKNPTIVNFPIKNLEMGEYAKDTLSARYDLVANVTHEGGLSTSSTGSMTTTAQAAQRATQRVFRVHLHTNSQPERWFQIQDLRIQEMDPNLIGLGETYLQIWQRRK